MTSIEQVIQAYQNCELNVQTILVEGQFKHLQQLI